MAKKSATDRVLQSIRKQNQEFEPKSPIASGMFLPNHSGDHSAGRVLTTPTTDFQIANKKYIDDNAGVSDHTLLTNISTASPLSFPVFRY